MSKEEILQALKDLVKELDLQQDKLPNDNDRIWDRIHIAKDVIKKSQK